MPPKRPPAPPPIIPGYQFVRVLGSGGFSDVYLYEQQLPRRQVAVKVLLEHASSDLSREQFVAEANLMAQLSAHPSIVTIYHADTAADGRPFLVMEYCPRPNLSVRYRKERLAVAEALRIGIRLAGAVETAHRIGILHRDIKPANVLTTDYGWPALTDFGISVLSSSTPAEEAVGMSIPWAAPEFFADDASRGVPGDIYSLGATIYTVLAGRSPFEEPGAANSALDLITRIERTPVPPIDRPDVPPVVESVLARSLAKRQDARYPSAASFGRALQRIEQELQLSQTSLDVPDTSALAVGLDDDGEDLRTRARMVTTVQQQQGYVAPTPRPAAPAQPPGAVPASYAAGSPVAAPDSPFQAGTPAPPAGEPDEPVQRRRWPALVASGAVVLAVLAIVVIGALNRPDVPVDVPTTQTTAPTIDPSSDVEAAPPPPQGLEGVREGDVVRFTWTAPEFDGDLSYVWQLRGADELDATPTNSTTLELADPGTVCVQVASRSESGRLSEYVDACAG